jgi:hypothetical protein
MQNDARYRRRRPEDRQRKPASGASVVDWRAFALVVILQEDEDERAATDDNIRINRA